MAAGRGWIAVLGEARSAGKAVEPGEANGAAASSNPGKRQTGWAAPRHTLRMRIGGAFTRGVGLACPGERTHVRKGLGLWGRSSWCAGPMGKRSRGSSTGFGGLTSPTASALWGARLVSRSRIVIGLTEWCIFSAMGSLGGYVRCARGMSTMGQTGRLRRLRARLCVRGHGQLGDAVADP